MTVDYDLNLYYHPEKSGLEIFEHVDNDHASYDFDDLVIWKRLSDGKLFYATDSGCSCPSPFEGFETVEDLTPLVNLEQFELDFEQYRNPYKDYEPRCTVDRKQEVLRKVKAHLETLK